MEKPTKVEVGQRWRLGENASDYGLLANEVYVVTSRSWGEDWLATEEGRDIEGLSLDPRRFAQATFLGWAPGFGPTPPPAVPADCAAPKPAIESTPPGDASGRAMAEMVKAMDVLVPPIRHFPGIPCYAMGCTKCGILPPQAREPFFAPPRFPAMELNDGVRPLSALEAIRSRPKVEPWVPSVDDWDLLPDAGT